MSYCYLESTDGNAYYCSNCSSETAFYVKGFLSERETIKNNSVHYTDTRLVAEKERATYKTQKNKKRGFIKNLKKTLLTKKKKSFTIGVVESLRNLFINVRGGKDEEFEKWRS